MSQSEIEEMTPRTLDIYLSSFSEKIKQDYETNYNLQIINAFHNVVFKSKKHIDIKKYLLGENKKKVKKMNTNELLDALKKCHLSFGGKISDF